VIRSKGQNFTIGPTKDFDGKRAHTPSQLAALNKYSDRLRDYCHQGDPMCAVGSEPVNVYNHLDYFLEHNEEVVAWVAEKAKGESGGQVSQEQPSTSLSTPSPPERSSSALTSSSLILASSSFPTHTNTPSQTSPTTSAIAKSAAASPTPSIIASPTQTATDIFETQSAQAGNTGTSNGNGGTGNDTTGAASALVVSPLFAVAAAVVVLAI
jgi:hypothetical protein